MIHLTQADCPPELLPTLRQLRNHFGPLSGCAWFTGKGPWDAILKADARRCRQFAFLFQDGSHRFPQPGDMSENRGFIKLMLAIDEIVTTMDPEVENGAVILRPMAYIALLSAGNLYVPLPDSSAHERLEDPAILEREFPGIFKF